MVVVRIILSCIAGVFECIAATLITVFEVIVGAIECVFAGTFSLLSFSPSHFVLTRARAWKRYSASYSDSSLVSARFCVAGKDLFRFSGFESC